MPGHHAYAGYGIMSRVRPTCSQYNLHTAWASEQQTEQRHNSATGRQRNKSLSSAPSTPVSLVAPSTHDGRRQRNHSVSHTVPSTQTRKPHDAGHWPPLEFDPLKLNPTVVAADVVTEKAPPRLYERGLLRTTSMRTRSNSNSDKTKATPTQKQQAESFEPRTRPRLHHSDSAISFDYDAYSNEKQQFNFGLAKETKAKVVPVEHVAPQDVHLVVVNNQKGWPSPASSVDSGKSWFDLDDDEDEDAYDDESITDDESEADQHGEHTKPPPSPQRRPQVGSPDDPTNYLKRGAWKRRGIFFGQQSNEVYEKEEDAFDV